MEIINNTAIYKDCRSGHLIVWCKTEIDSNLKNKTVVFGCKNCKARFKKITKVK